MINAFVMVLGSALLVVASPAAADTAKPTAEPAGTAISDTAPAAAKAGKPTRYCVEDTVTGSRLRQRFCQTREQWLAQGYDPLAKD